MTPAAGSRPVLISQNAAFVFTPTPSGVGHVISGASFFSGTGGGAAGLRCGLRVCANTGAAIAAAMTIAARGRMSQCSRPALAPWNAKAQPSLDGHRASYGLAGAKAQTKYRSIVTFRRYGPSGRASMTRRRRRLQMRGEELVHAVPGVAQHV